MYQVDDLNVADYDRTDPGSLRDELALCRALTHKAAKSNNAGLANALLNTAAKLSVSHEAHEVRASQRLDRQAVLAVAREIVAVVCSEIDTLDLPEETKVKFLDAVISRVGMTVDNARNAAATVQQPLRLEHTK